MSRLTPRHVCELARAFPGVTEKDHFGAEAFIANGRIFVTVWHDKGIANLMVPREVQKRFLERDGGDAFRTLDNAWGDHAFSAVLKDVELATLKEALAAAYAHSGVKRTKLGGTKKAAAKKPAKPAAKKRPGRSGKR